MADYPLEQLAFRRPGAGDAEAVLDLMLRCDVAEYGSPDSDMEDILHDWQHIDLDRDAWLATAPNGALLAYGAVLPSGQDVRYEFYVDPDWASRNLGDALLGLCEERAGDIGRGRQSNDPFIARIYMAHVNERDRPTVEAAGFQPGKYYFQMEIETSGELPEPRWPGGVAVRTARPGVDDRAVYELIQAAFDRPGRVWPTFEAWQERLMRPDIFDASLWSLAEAQGALCGALLAFNFTSGGWVRQLAVLPDWRRQGIGTALLAHTFRAFRELAVPTVGLSVESARPDAHAFYRKIGMKQRRQFDEYTKTSDGTTGVL